MRVLAFDPGYERLGIAVLEKVRGKEILLHSTCIRTSQELPFPERLRILGAAAEDAINTFSPQIMALEDIYFEKNAKTAMHVAEVRGMLCYIAARGNMRVVGLTPLQVKIATTGYGKSDKKAVAAMVARLIDLPAPLPGKKRLDDELDAIAIGLSALAMEHGAR